MWGMMYDRGITSRNRRMAQSLHSFRRGARRDYRRATGYNPSATTREQAPEAREMESEENERKKEMSYEQISESTYYQNMSYWNQVAQNYRALGGLGICDDETGEELYTV